MSRWVIFISVFLSIYGAFHLYLLIKARRAFYLEGWAYLLLVVLLLFMMLAPFQARLLESQDHAVPALIMTWIGSFWMGWIFIWLWLALVVDVYHIGIGLVARLAQTDWIHLLLSRRQGFLLTVAVAGAVAIYGVYAAQQVHLEHVTLNHRKITREMGSIRIAQISDVHMGPMLFPGKLEKIVSTLQSARPDLIVSTGDLIDGRLRVPYDVMRQLTALTAPLGKFAVTGNHEVYAGLSEALDFTRLVGFSILRGQSVSVADKLTIVGVDDPATGQYHKMHESALLADTPADRFTVLLKHQPVLTSPSENRFDLQLSGHTHKGQILPFGWVVKSVYPLFSGLYALPKDSYVYVSRGTGTWGPPMRFFAPPEVTIIDLLPWPTASGVIDASAGRIQGAAHSK